MLIKLISLILPLTIHPNRLLLLTCPQECTQCPHSDDDCNILLISQHWRIHVLMLIRQRCYCVRIYFSSNSPYALFVLLGCFVRWEVSGRTIAVFVDYSMHNLFKKLPAFFCSSNRDFPRCNSLASMSCIHTVVLIQLQLKNSFFVLSKISDFRMIDIQWRTVYTFTKVMLTSFSVDMILLLR